jgi:phospholipid/cholesterol/gamma-HCH transport system permease protein
MRLSLWLLNALLYSLSRLSVLRLRPIRKQFLNQLELAGGGALMLSGSLGILFGTVIFDQTVRMVGAASDVPLRLLGWSLFGEAGALVIGFLIAAKIAPTMGANLALMRFRGELDHLSEINISVADYLIIPRVISLSAAGALLSVYFMACALLGGMLIASVLRDFSFLHQLARFFEIVSPFSIVFAVLKSSLFGGTVALVSCYYGLVVERDAERLSEAGSDALTRSILVLCALDAAGLMFSIAAEA